MEIQALIPNYVKSFGCLGSDCGYTCCMRWQIDFSKTDYKRLRKAKFSPETRALVNQTIVRRPEEQVTTADRYAAIRMREDGCCPLLDEQGLCRLQRECGAEMLPGTCQRFPRISNEIFGNAELNVRLVCEASVLPLLRMPEGVQFESKLVDISGTRGYYFFEESSLEKNPLLRYYFDIKMLFVGILQSDYFPLSSRVLYLGVILQRLLQMEKDGRVAEVRELLHGLTETAENPEIRDALAAMPVNSPQSMLQMSLFCHIKGDQRYEALFERALDRMGTFDPETGKIQLDGTLYQAARREFDAFCQKHPRVMENIAVALLHEEAQPFGGVFNVLVRPDSDERLDLWCNYIYYVRELASLQFLLGALTTPDTTPEEFASNVAVILRGGLGCVGGRVMVEQVLERELGGLDGLSVLLKG